MKLNLKNLPKASKKKIIELAHSLKGNPPVDMSEFWKRAEEVYKR